MFASYGPEQLAVTADVVHYYWRVKYLDPLVVNGVKGEEATFACYDEFVLMPRNSFYSFWSGKCVKHFEQNLRLHVLCGGDNHLGRGIELFFAAAQDPSVIKGYHHEHCE